MAKERSGLSRMWARRFSFDFRAPDCPRVCEKTLGVERRE